MTTLRFALAGLAAAAIAACAAAPPDRNAPANTPAPVASSPSTLMGFARTAAPRLAAARYMHGNCVAATWPGYEGLPLERCRYGVVDRGGAERSAEVVLLDAEAPRIAAWIASACARIGRAEGADADRCRSRLLDRILAQSGGQFPVAGVVLEDLLPADGVFETYAFRNGVTVRLEGAPHRATRALSPEEVAVTLDPAARVAWVGAFGRIASTTRDELAAFAGAPPAGERWDETVGRLYRAAFSADDNVLVDAFAAANADAL